jgi:hypothetical protein
MLGTVGTTGSLQVPEKLVVIIEEMMYWKRCTEFLAKSSSLNLSKKYHPLH